MWRNKKCMEVLGLITAIPKRWVRQFWLDNYARLRKGYLFVSFSDQHKQLRRRYLRLIVPRTAKQPSRQSPLAKSKVQSPCVAVFSCFSFNFVSTGRGEGGVRNGLETPNERLGISSVYHRKPRQWGFDWIKWGSEFRESNANYIEINWLEVFVSVDFGEFYPGAKGNAFLLFYFISLRHRETNTQIILSHHNIPYMAMQVFNFHMAHRPRDSVAQCLLSDFSWTWIAPFLD